MTPKNFHYRSLLLAALGLFVLIGCKRPPTRIEGHFFDIKTNVTPVVHVITNTTFITNQFPVLVERPVYIVVTNNFGVPVVATNWNFATNWEALVTTKHTLLTETNWTESHVYTTKESTTEGAQTVGSIVNTFVPGLGGIIGIALTGAAGIWARWRSRKANEALIAGVQTGREIIKAIATDPEVDVEYRRWLIEHEREVGVYEQITKLIEKTRDEPAAREDAKAILAQTDQPITTPPVA